MKFSFIMIVVNFVLWIICEIIDDGFNFSLITDDYDEIQILHDIIYNLKYIFLSLFILWIGILIICFICWCANLPPAPDVGVIE